MNLKQEQSLSFSGHETFVFRYAWLKKAVNATFDNPALFQAEDALVCLGVGKNMVRSIRHWALATQILEEVPETKGRELRATELGSFLFGPEGLDPFLEDPNSLWLLHWNLVSGPSKATVWSWAFSLLPFQIFNKDTLLQAILSELRRLQAKPPSMNTLKRDLDIFLRTYVVSDLKPELLEDSLDCPLTELHLIEKVAHEDAFQFKIGPKRSLSDPVFAYALIDFWERRAPRQEALSFSEIAYAPGSPGNVFKLDENSLSERLERLDSITDGSLDYAETAGLRQVYKRAVTNKMSYLHKHYQGSTVFSLVLIGN